MRRLLASIAFAASALASTAPARAETVSIEFTAPIGSQTLGKKLTGADLMLVRGFTIGGSALSHEIVFRSDLTDIDINMSWISGEAGDPFRLVGINLDLLDSTNTVIASDSFVGLLEGVAHSSLIFTSLRPSQTYRLLLTGTVQTRAVYTLAATMRP